MQSFKDLVFYAADHDLDIPDEIYDSGDASLLREFLFPKQHVTIEPYSERSFVVRGETKPYREDLLQLGGKWNPKLQGGPGWIFPNTKESQVRQFVQSVTKPQVVLTEQIPERPFIPPEVMLEHTVRYMDIRDILNLCLTGKSYSGICEDRELWRYLLERDFGVGTMLDDPKKLYLDKYGKRIQWQEYRGKRVWKPQVGNYVSRKAWGDASPYVVGEIEKDKQGRVVKANLMGVKSISPLVITKFVREIRLTASNNPKWIDVGDKPPYYDAYYPGVLESYMNPNF